MFLFVPYECGKYPGVYPPHVQKTIPKEKEKNGGQHLVIIDLMINSSLLIMFVIVIYA